MEVELNDQNFNQEIKAFKGVALVDFWAPWCGPCKVQGLTIAELAKDFVGNGQVKIGQLNVDENQSTANDFEVMSIPTIKIFKDGQEMWSVSGLQNKDTLTQNINKYLA